MVLEVEPTAEDFETAILRPSRFVCEPTRKLLSENLVAQLAQGFVDLSVRVTLWDQVDRRLPYQLSQSQAVASWIDRVEPIEEGLLGLHHNCRSIQRGHHTPPLSRRTTFVTTVQAAHLRNGNDLTLVHDRSRVRSVLSQCQVRPRAVVVAQIDLQQPAKVSLIQNHNMVQALTSNRANQPLGKCVLPRTPRCSDNLFDPQGLDSVPKCAAVAGITVAD